MRNFEDNITVFGPRMSLISPTELLFPIFNFGHRKHEIWTVVGTLNGIRPAVNFALNMITFCMMTKGDVIHIMMFFDCISNYLQLLFG